MGTGASVAVTVQAVPQACQLDMACVDIHCPLAHAHTRPVDDYASVCQPLAPLLARGCRWSRQQRGRLLEDVINRAEALCGDATMALPPMVKTFLQQVIVRCIEDVEYPEPDHQQIVSLLTILSELVAREAVLATAWSPGGSGAGGGTGGGDAAVGRSLADMVTALYGRLQQSPIAAALYVVMVHCQQIEQHLRGCTPGPRWDLDQALCMTFKYMLHAVKLLQHQRDRNGAGGGNGGGGGIRLGRRASVPSGAAAGTAAAATFTRPSMPALLGPFSPTGDGSSSGAAGQSPPQQQQQANVLPRALQLSPSGHRLPSLDARAFRGGAAAAAAVAAAPSAAPSAAAVPTDRSSAPEGRRLPSAGSGAAGGGAGNSTHQYASHQLPAPSLMFGEMAAPRPPPPPLRVVSRPDSAASSSSVVSPARPISNASQTSNMGTPRSRGAGIPAAAPAVGSSPTRSGSAQRRGAPRAGAAAATPAAATATAVDTASRPPSAQQQGASRPPHSVGGWAQIPLSTASLYPSSTTNHTLAAQDSWAAYDGPSAPPLTASMVSQAAVASSSRRTTGEAPTAAGARTRPATPTSSSSTSHAFARQPTTAGRNAPASHDDPNSRPSSAASQQQQPVVSAVPQYSVRPVRQVEYDDLRRATDSFAHSNKIGSGGYGPVYKGVLDDNLMVAIKLLDDSEDARQGMREFESETMILGSLSHPHIVRLLGTCSARGCLVYEFASHGSLEDYMARTFKQASPPLPATARAAATTAAGTRQNAAGAAAATGGARRADPVEAMRGGGGSSNRWHVPCAPLGWWDRLRICFEVAQALDYLHSYPTAPIVHMDLKPANILLCSGLVSKLSDVGLARLSPELAVGKASTVLDSRSQIIGTLSYIDPEYLRSGRFSTLSDVYALGIIMLQLLTGQELVKGLVARVEVARATGAYALCDVADTLGGQWPPDVVHRFADLALECVEFRHTDRPSLRGSILPQLQAMLQESLP